MNAPEPSAPARMDRRSAIKWMLTAAASARLLDANAFAADAAAPTAKGYGTDPDLLRIYKSGDLWPLTLTEPQRRTAAALCDVIIPADEKSPGASAVGVPDFIDEWISSPYPAQAGDRRTILEGLAWIDAEARRRFSNDFAGLTDAQKTAICDDICFAQNAKAEFRTGALFFKRYRDLTAGGFYTTPAGMKDIGYTGNVPLAVYPGPPVEALRQLGLA